jgi:hypothetical protein
MKTRRRVVRAEMRRRGTKEDEDENEEEGGEGGDEEKGKSEKTGQTPGKTLNPSCSPPHRMSTLGGETASSMPSLRMFSISTPSCSSPRACTSYRSTPPAWRREKRERKESTQQQWA